MLFFDFKEGRYREPNWHPNAAELDYIIKGRARMTIFSPGGDIDTFEVGPDQLVFIPTAYFHYIENIGDEELHFAVFLVTKNRKISVFLELLDLIQTKYWEQFLM